MDIIEVKVSRLMVDRHGYGPDGQYIGVGQGRLYWVNYYYPNGRYKCKIENAVSYQDLRRHLKTFQDYKVLP